jgi:hypothetical protein
MPRDLSQALRSAPLADRLSWLCGHVIGIPHEQDPPEIENMNMPGFTAESSLYGSRNRYTARTVDVARNNSVQPQYVIPPWTPCSWLFFCCTEFGDASCCRRWHLQCIAE